MATGRARLKDVASLAHVSESTASKVVNGVTTSSVRSETRARILAAVQQLDYRPHAAARLLAGQPSRAVALLVPELTNPIYVTLIRGAYQRARHHSYTMLLAEDFDEQRADETFTQLVQTGRVDGLLIASAHPAHRLIAWLETHWVPHVFVNRSVPGSECNVVMQFGRASSAAVEHLVALGHRHIGHIGGPRGIETGQARVLAFRKALREHGREAGPVVRHGFEEAGGARGLHELLDSQPDLSAVYTSSLSQAIGALHACRERGIDVPRRLSIIAADELPFAGYLAPPLTTVQMPLAELGSAAVDGLLEQLAGKPSRNVTIRTPARVIVRDSTAPPRVRGGTRRERLAIG